MIYISRRKHQIIAWTSRGQTVTGVSVWVSEAGEVNGGPFTPPAFIVSAEFAVPVFD